MRHEDGEPGRSPVRAVSELVAAICDGRIDDMLAFVHPRVVWRPVARPGLSVYQGHAGMVRLVGDLRAAYGRYRLDVEDITADTDVVVTADAEAHVTVRARVVRETDHGDVALSPITSVFTLRGGLVTSMDGEPDTDAR